MATAVPNIADCSILFLCRWPTSLPLLLHRGYYCPILDSYELFYISSIYLYIWPLLESLSGASLWQLSLYNSISPTGSSIFIQQIKSNRFELVLFVYSALNKPSTVASKKPTGNSASRDWWNYQGWEFAHLISERIARFFVQKWANERFAKKNEQFTHSLIFG